MRLIVAGGRNYKNWDKVREELDFIHEYKNGQRDPLDVVEPVIKEIVCGMCSEGILTYKEILTNGRAIRVYGADGLGYRWAKENNIPIKEFPANWQLFKTRAGPLRNGKMADYADALIAFPGLAGTNDMVDKARRMNLMIFDRREL